TAVDFYPFRNGNAANPDTGEYPVLTAPIPMSDAPPTVQLSAPASAARGATVTLTASPADDFGVKRVRFTVGTTTLGTVTLPPYTLTSTIPEDAACGSTRSYTAIATDSLGQTGSATRAVTVTCSTQQQDAGSQGNDDQSPAPQAQGNVL